MPFNRSTIYLDRLQLPIMPAEITVNNEDQTEVFSLVDGTPVVLAKLDGATSISFDFEIPNETAPYVSGTLQPVQNYIDFLEGKKANREKIVLTITRSTGHTTNKTMILRDYSYTESATNASDFTFSITLTESYDWQNRKVSTVRDYETGEQYTVLRFPSGWTIW